MNSLENSFKAAMNLLPVLVFTGMSDMLRPILAPEIEDKLGRKLTGQEWDYYMQESYRKAEIESLQQTIRQWCQQLVDRQIIRDFVWNKE